MPIFWKNSALALATVVALVGCADRTKIQKKSIEDLYFEAQRASAAAVAAAQPTTTEYESFASADFESEGSPVVAASAINLSDDSSSDYEVQSVLFESDGTTSIGGDLLPEQVTASHGNKPTRINEYFEQTDVREVLDILSSTTGDTIMVDDMVSGIVTTQLNNVTFEEALERVLLPLGLVYSKYDGSYIVAPPDPRSPLFRFISQRTQYEPKHHLPSKLTELLPARFRDYFQGSDERNLIVIDAPKHIADEIQTRLYELDQPVDQVVLEAIVCVTAPDKGFRFGMDWNHVLKLNSSEQLNVGLSGLAFRGAGSQFGVENAFDDFSITSAFVQLLAQEGYVTIRAAPRVTAKDGEKASISIARETFFSLQPANANVLFRQDVQKVDAGIGLQIIPRIRGDMVSVQIDRAEVSEDIRTNTKEASTNNTFPVINRRQVSTKVDVPDGHTIVIGGLIQKQTIERVNRIPVLGSIPVIGSLFRTVEQQEQEVEVAIFISPKIIRSCPP